MPRVERSVGAAKGPRDPLASTTSALLTDYYELTMLDAYVARDMHEEAVFEFFVRRMPKQRNFLVAAGLEQLLDYLESLSFATEELEWLEATGKVTPRLLDYLDEFRFSGELRAMPEGSIFFADEPVVQVIAPLPQAQLIETRLINLLQFQTIVASKAARCVLAAPDKLLVGFGLRRAHGAEAGLLAARAAYLAGFAGTSNVLAEKEYGVPMYGTMAHSFVQVHASEIEAFEHFAYVHPDNTVLLIDTYDTLAAAREVTRLARRLRREGIGIRAVRLDSGDLPILAARVREILDTNDCADIGIFASGSLDEFALAAELASAPIDGYGIGTRLDVSADVPYLDCAYKIQEYAGRARRKRSTGKATWPGRKQVYRRFADDGQLRGDIITLCDEAAEGEALLEPVMRHGQRLAASPPLETVRTRVAAGLATLPQPLRQLDRVSVYPVDVAASIRALAAEVDRDTG